MAELRRRIDVLAAERREREAQIGRRAQMDEGEAA